jgi:uncharacterized phage protein gp47/JayE
MSDVTTLVYIDSAGFHASDYPTWLDFVTGVYQGIYGSDVYLGADSQDGQWVAAVAQMLYDTQNVIQSTYNSFSPVTGQGTGLSRLVKINGIERNVSSNSTVQLVVVGQAFTVLNNAIAVDILGQQWALPAMVTILSSGTITVTATAVTTGAIQAESNTITGLFTPMQGWQSINNPDFADIVFTSNPANLDTIDVNGVTITFVTSSPTGNQVQIGGGANATAANLYAFLAGSVNPDITQALYTVSINIVTVTNVPPPPVGNYTGSFSLSTSSSAITLSGLSSGDLSGGAATAGQGVETDPELRARQIVSVANPSQTIFDGTIGAVANVSGVIAVEGYENDSDSTDSNGLPPHSISIVVVGGAEDDIADAIQVHKTPGTNTYGTTTVDTVDSRGMPVPINFYYATPATISVQVTITPLTGYDPSYAALIQASIATFIQCPSLPIGALIVITKLYPLAYLNGAPQSLTYDVDSIEIEKNGGGFISTNIQLDFNEEPICAPTNVTVVT